MILKIRSDLDSSWEKNAKFGKKYIFFIMFTQICEKMRSLFTSGGGIGGAFDFLLLKSGMIPFSSCSPAASLLSFEAEAEAEAEAMVGSSAAPAGPRAASRQERNCIRWPPGGN